ncbi:hypothetical protein PF008_g28811 [Phytophthora fragariae]|uniref:Uncharacterized protein n=1 Tax=Phytophthora fragariae TaxID=53985 RepID=A0A6G0QA89_9STRA|nr:hypothetical protein PF008_g28811 [Phytophthora fragariae]
MRDIIAVNALSSGLDILDDVAKALIDDTGRAAQALSGPVTILPHPSMQSASAGATPHPSFTSPSKKRSVPAKQAKGSAAKKQKASASPTSSPVAPGTALITFPFGPGSPEGVRTRPGRHLPPCGGRQLKGLATGVPVGQPALVLRSGRRSGRLPWSLAVLAQLPGRVFRVGAARAFAYRFGQGPEAETKGARRPPEAGIHQPLHRDMGLL